MNLINVVERHWEKTYGITLAYFKWLLENPDSKTFQIFKDWWAYWKYTYKYLLRMDEDENEIMAKFLSITQALTKKEMWDFIIRWVDRSEHFPFLWFLELENSWLRDFLTTPDIKDDRYFLLSYQITKQVIHKILDTHVRLVRRRRRFGELYNIIVDKYVRSSRYPQFDKVGELYILWLKEKGSPESLELYTDFIRQRSPLFQYDYSKITLFGGEFKEAIEGFINRMVAEKDIPSFLEFIEKEEFHLNRVG